MRSRKHDRRDPGGRFAAWAMLRDGPLVDTAERATDPGGGCIDAVVEAVAWLRSGEHGVRPVWWGAS